MTYDSKIPSGPIAHKWANYCDSSRLVSPKNKRHYHVLVVGSGLAGASAAASLAELGYQVSCFCLQDSARRAHSIAAQGALTQPKTIATMVTAFTACFTTPLRVATFGLVKRMSIGWLS